MDGLIFALPRCVFSSSFAILYSELDDVRLQFTTRSFPPGRKTKPCAPPKTVQLLQQIIKWIAHVGRINCNHSCFFGIKQNQGKPFCWKSVHDSEANGGSYILDRKSGTRIPLYEKGGVYRVRVWIKGCNKEPASGFLGQAAVP